jgi:hypothetical protein
LVLKMVDDAGHSAKEHGIRKLLVEVSPPPPPVPGLSSPSFCLSRSRHLRDLGFVRGRICPAGGQIFTVERLHQIT